MAITQGMTTTFKEELLLGGHDFSTSGASAGTFTIALYNVSSNTFGPAISAYTATDEITDSTGTYVSGGYNAANELTVNTAPTNGGSGTTAYTSFADKTFTGSTFTANCGLIYNNSPAGNASGRTNPSVAVLDFGGRKVVAAGDFTLRFPTAAASTAIIRIV